MGRATGPPPYHRPGGDTGFTIAGQPAADAMQRCYADD